MRKFAFREVIYMFLIYISYLFTQGTIYGEFLGRSKYYIYLIIILLGVIYLIKKATVKRELLYYLLITIAPYCIILLYTFYQNFSGHVYDNTYTIVFIYWMIPIITMFCGLYLFGINAVDLTHNAMIMNYTFVIIFFIIQERHFVFGNLLAGFSNSVLEAGQITFSFGMLTVFYMFFDNRQSHCLNKRSVISLVFTILGLKRIVYIALFVALFLAFSSKHIKGLLKLKNIKIFSLIIIICIYGYIYIVKTGIYEAFFTYLNIDTFGRTSVYNYFSQFYDFSLLFSGMGVGFCVKELANPAIYLREIRDIHNDLLKMYIELGGILSLLFFVNLILLQTKRIYKRFSNKAAKLYFVLIVYTIVICTTDNILRYNDFIMILNLLPFIVILQEKKQKGCVVSHGTNISV